MPTQPDAFSWATLTNTGMFLLVVVGAFWALAFGPIQDKFSTNEKRDVELRNDIRRIQTEFRGEINRIDAELLSRRSEFVSQPEFKQFENRVDITVAQRFEVANQRLQIIESTRPTTGELGAVAKSTENSLTQLEARIRALEATTPRFANPATSK